jgi:hypothetical protein
MSVPLASSRLLPQRRQPACSPERVINATCPRTRNEA